MHEVVVFREARKTLQRRGHAPLYCVGSSLIIDGL